MKRTILILLLAVTVQLTHACSCIPWYAFCATTSNLENDLILSGKIIYSDTLSIKIRVFEIFKGQESKDTITIWNGTEFDCNGIIPMKANELGNINDTIVVILPRITNESIENSWDVVGDYRRPMPLCFTPALEIKGDSLFGMINNSGLSNPYWSFNKMLFEDFRQLWSNGQIDCSELVNVQEIIVLPSIDFEIINKEVKITSKTNETFNVQMIDIKGIQENLGDFSSSTTIGIKNKKSGIYILQIKSRKELIRRKIIIN